MSVFDDIYRTNGWNGTDSRSGPGSGAPATRAVAAAIADLIAEVRAESVLDVGCGDGYWFPDVGGFYVGLDASTEAIALARARHPDRTYVSGDVRDPTFASLAFDLVVCRDLIQHLPLADGVDLLAGLRHVARGGLLLVSTYVGGDNVDVAVGDTYAPDLCAPPFDMPEPDRLIFDGYHYHDHDTDEVRDPRKFLALWVS